MRRPFPAPCRQVALVERRVRAAGLGGVEVLTVDKCQGRDKDAVILSLVRSNDARDTGALIVFYFYFLMPLMALPRLLPALLVMPPLPPPLALWFLSRSLSLSAARLWIQGSGLAHRFRVSLSAPIFNSWDMPVPRCPPPLRAGKLLQDVRRINVAITRAKKKLVLLGDAATLATVPLLARLLELVRERGWYLQLPPGACPAPPPPEGDAGAAAARPAAAPARE